MNAAYKYACFQAFSIPTESDNDADAQTHEVKPSAKTQANQGVAIDIIASVKGGNAMSEAKKLAGMSEAKMNAIWALLDAETQDKLTEVWPA